MDDPKEESSVNRKINIKLQCGGYKPRILGAKYFIKKLHFSLREIQKLTSKMSAAKIRVINKQTDETWALLYKRLASMNVQYERIIHPEIVEFFINKAKSVATHIGFMLPSVIVTCNFLLATKKVKIEAQVSYQQNLNLFMMLLGPPSTGKSPAIKEAVVEPLQNINQENFMESVISNTTSAGLTKLLARRHECFLTS